MVKAELKNALVDFSKLPADGLWLQQPLASWPLGYQANTTDWTRQMDAMIFTRHMTPNTKAERIR